ncbi:hypothetical protein BpHYR1_005770 [Brachionus plicatilis]|uniref:Uncharacterized protein n=1 Tax=Brachionus plicatilis TaxID=10195 RepID=A0A3M7SJE1_BRAPC|nr:hypothetical protein BpHYR1_005770 [Brachionus plicatilis]
MTSLYHHTFKEMPNPESQYSIQKKKFLDCLLKISIYGINFEFKFVPNYQIDLTDELQFKRGGAFDVTTMDSPVFVFSSVGKIQKNLSIFENLSGEVIVNFVYSKLNLAYSNYCNYFHANQFSFLKNCYEIKKLNFSFKTQIEILSIGGHEINATKDMMTISLNIYELNKFLYENQNWFEYKFIKINVFLDTNENPCNCLLQWLKKCESKDLNSTCDYKMLENNCKNLQMNSFKSKMTFTLYNFMALCSIVNLFYCLILAFHIMNSCTVINGIFCSSLYGNVLVQYYEIYLVDFLCVSFVIILIGSNIDKLTSSIVKSKDVKDFGLNLQIKMRKLAILDQFKTKLSK